MPRITITVPEKTAQPYRFQLDRPAVTLGRGSENDIPIDCPSVSVKHAEMVRVPGGYELRDLGSTNGIKLDGIRQPVIPLSNGVAVKLGDVAFEFVLSEEELESLRREEPPVTSAAIRETTVDDLDPDMDPPSLAPKPGPVIHVQQESAGSEFLVTLVFLTLSLIAFFVGMAVRHQKDTGNSLLDAIRNRPAAEAPARK